MTFLIILAQRCQKHLPNNITAPCCYSVLGSQDIPFNAHAENAKTDLLSELVSKLLSGFETKIACQLTGHCNFCFPLTASPSAQTQVGYYAVTSSHRYVANVMRTETFSALRKFILDQLLFNRSRFLLRIWHTSTKQGVNSYSVCQIGIYLSHYEFLLAGKRGGQLATHLPSKSQGKSNIYKRLNISDAPTLWLFLNLERKHDVAGELHSPHFSHPSVGRGTQLHTRHGDGTPSMLS